MTWILALLAACTPQQTGCDPNLEVGYQDADGDGYGDLSQPVTECQALPSVPDASDCDDQDPDVHPDSTEVCDGVDNDCSGAVDDDASDAPVWYADLDGDGYGDPESTVAACSLPSGYTDDSQDCDDSDAAIQPLADELCDGVDNDCDGETDEDSAVDALTWHADLDGDGFGDASAPALACAQPSDHVADHSDCDDSDPDTFPGAPELCDGHDDNCDGVSDEDSAVDAGSWHLDADGDGFGDPDDALPSCAALSGRVADSSDCDDSDLAIHPDALEVCDGIDNDCSGAADEDSAVDALTWYADSDSDGYGDFTDSAQACTQPSGRVSRAGDCDDTDGATYPGADEICDSADNDCDGSSDESAVDAGTWYTDADSDGYGTTASATVSCTQPSGTVASDGDCDDGDASISPGATELCDSVDNDCDGSTDEDDAADAATWYADADGDGYGDSSSTTTACTQPSGTTSDATDCDDADDSAYPGGEELCDGADNDCDGSVDGTSVPGDYSTIQGAIDAASSGDLICVASGTWYETLDFSGKDVIVGGSSGSGATTLDGGGSGPVVTADSGESTSAMLHGFTVTNGDAQYGAGIYVENSGLSLKDVVSTGNNYSGSCFGAGLYSSNATLAIQDSRFDANTCDAGWGVGAYLSGSTVTVQSTSFDQNSAGNHSLVYGVGLYLSGTTLSGTDLSASENEAEGGGAASALGLGQYNGTSTITGLVVEGNQTTDTGSGEITSASGGVIALRGSSASATWTDLSLDDNTIAADGDIQGGLLYCRDGTLVLDTVSISGVDVSTSQDDIEGGLFYLESCTASMAGLEIDGNSVSQTSTALGGYTADVDGGLLQFVDTTATLDDLSVTDNAVSHVSTAGGVDGGLIYVEGTSRVDISDFEIHDNTLDCGGSCSGALFYSYAKSLDLSQGWLADNIGQSGLWWGGVGAVLTPVSLTNVIVANNQLQDGAVGTTFYGKSNADLELTNVDLVDNSCSSGSSGSCTGGGILAQGGDYTFLNVNVVGHTSAAGGVIYDYYSTANTSFEYSNFYNNGGSAFTNVTTPSSSDGNLFVDPSYTDTSATDAMDWDLSLASGSSCIDAGDSSLRDRDASRSDIGAYGGWGGNW